MSGSTSDDAAATNQESCVIYESSVGYVINSKSTELSGRRIMKVYVHFKGANIALVSFGEVRICSLYFSSPAI